MVTPGWIDVASNCCIWMYGKSKCCYRFDAVRSSRSLDVHCTKASSATGFRSQRSWMLCSRVTELAQLDVVASYVMGANILSGGRPATSIEARLFCGQVGYSSYSLTASPSANFLPDSAQSQDTSAFRGS